MVQPQIIDEMHSSMDSVTIGYAKQHTKKLGTQDFWKGIVFIMASVMAASNLDLLGFKI